MIPQWKLGSFGNFRLMLIRLSVKYDMENLQGSLGVVMIRVAPLMLYFLMLMASLRMFLCVLMLLVWYSMLALLCNNYHPISIYGHNSPLRWVLCVFICQAFNQRTRPGQGGKKWGMLRTNSVQVRPCMVAILERNTLAKQCSEPTVQGVPKKGASQGLLYFSKHETASELRHSPIKNCYPYLPLEYQTNFELYQGDILHQNLVSNKKTKNQINILECFTFRIFINLTTT